MLCGLCERTGGAVASILEGSGLPTAASPPSPVLGIGCGAECYRGGQSKRRGRACLGGGWWDKRKGGRDSGIELAAPQQDGHSCVVRVCDVQQGLRSRCGRGM